MKTLNKKQQKKVVELMAKEFLEYRLGIEANDDNVRRLAAYIIQFKKEVADKAQQNSKFTKNYKSET